MRAGPQDRQTDWDRNQGSDRGCGIGDRGFGIGGTPGEPRLSPPSPHSHSSHGVGHWARFSVISFRCRESFPSLLSHCELLAEMLNPSQSGGTPPA